MCVHRLMHLALGILVASCAAHAPSAAPPLPQLPPTSGLQVALTWSAPVDLDLYLTDPTWETAYFANTPSHTGARLLRDTRYRDIASGADTHVEIVAMTAPLPGRYHIGVDFIDACNAPPDPVSFRVVADYAGVRREATGTIRLAEFQPIVVEFELRQTAPDGMLSLVREGQ